MHNHLIPIPVAAWSLGLLLHVIVLISLGLLLCDSIFDLSRRCGFCFDLCVFVFVIGKSSVKESSSHKTQICETQVATVKASLKNSRC